MLLAPALSVSAVLFTLGVAGVLLRRNAIVIFMCVELMLNAVNLTFVALAQQLGVAGQLFVLFVMAVAAAEAAVGLAGLLLFQLLILRHAAPSEVITLPAGSVARLAQEQGLVASIARPLFDTYLLPFEVTSILLLAAIVGAVVLAKRKL